MVSLSRSLLIALIALLVAGPLLGPAALADTSDPNRPVVTATPEPTEIPSDAAPTGLDDASWPYADDQVDLAAVALPLDELPDVFSGYGEFHLDAHTLSQFGGGHPNTDAILATGFQTAYLSSFRNGSGHRIDITLYLFAHPQQVKGGFALIADDATNVPNGAFEDGPALDGVGDAPAKTTTGTTSDVPGGSTASYTVTFTVGPILIRVQMQASDAEELDTDLVDDLSAAQADRAQDALDGRDLSSIDPRLPSYILWSGVPFLPYDGFASESDDYLLATLTQVPDGFESAYSLSYQIQDQADSFYPYLSMVVASFADEDALSEAFDDPDSLISGFPEQDKLDASAFDGADNAVFASYALDDVGPGARLFLQFGNVLAIIDVQGTDTLDDAIAIATAFGTAQVSCVLGDGCAIPTDLPDGTIFDKAAEE